MPLRQKRHGGGHGGRDDGAGRRGGGLDYDHRVVWADLRWSVERGRRPDEPPQLIAGLDRVAFAGAYNHFEREHPDDVEKRIAALLFWLHGQVHHLGDVGHAAVERAYARSVERAGMWPKDIDPPATVLESKARGEALLRADHDDAQPISGS